MKEELFPIDIVLDWVDGNDPVWKKSKKQYEKEQSEEEKSIDDIRYRDWDCLKYVFRSIEKYASWVNKVFFVTCGQRPEWLNLENPKLVLVDHKDYIPSKYLPTFNCNTIELNYHRIKGLSEHFIVLNDDFYFTDYVKKEDFFIKGVPVDSFMEYPIMCGGGGSEAMAHILVNNYCLLGNHFRRNEYKNRLMGKILNINYGALLFYNCLQFIIPYPKFFGILTPHYALPYLKSSYEEVWNVEEERLDSVCMQKFRSDKDICLYVMRIWNLLKGNFIPRNVLKEGKMMSLTNDEMLFKAIENHQYKRICLNDTKCTIEEYKAIKKKLHHSFNCIMPEKSSFEL
ncbi:stealth family protein [Butyrivibrio sp. YAB3001]|uniref:stealth family protein n=1 Tax=Butyrivibrio sp. YAB3001 TaxID=1520812 RepID=UPI0008F62CAB|nr:stealth family protein [Butyrivibrio sp. YAB3001]SFC80210.1 Stealth protein CR1, conserved region 1 [Butyrivibrio sp. YAB3001]